MLRERERTLAWLWPGLVADFAGERFGPAKDLTELFEVVAGDEALLHGHHALWTGDRDPHRSTVSNQAYAAGAAAKEARSMRECFGWRVAGKIYAR